MQKLSCSVLLGSAWSCLVPVASLVGGPGGPCQENFMKNLLGKFHAEIVMEFS